MPFEAGTTWPADDHIGASLHLSDSEWRIHPYWHESSNNKRGLERQFLIGAFAGCGEGNSRGTVQPSPDRSAIERNLRGTRPVGLSGSRCARAGNRLSHGSGAWDGVISWEPGRLS